MFKRLEKLNMGDVMDDKLLEPLKYYEGQGRQEHRDNIEAHLNGLVEKSGVNIEENRLTMDKWKVEQQKIADLSKEMRKFKRWRGWLIFGIVVGAILLMVSFTQFSQSAGTGVLLLLLGAGLLTASILVMVKKVNPMIRNTGTVLQEHQAAAKELENEGWEQMQALNELFGDDDALRLIEKTLPDFAFEKNFSVKQQRLFYEQYDFYDLQNGDCSMLNTLAGKYAGNPFLFGRRRVHRMGVHTYHGTLLITWTETYRDSQGKLCTRTRSQTLHASVTKPKPYYHTNTFLAYGNQAAPRLSFSRESKHVEDLSERALERKIRKGEHKLQKQAEKSMKNGGNFQEMANAEFDVLFGATDRNNEVEFRLMYTPLGQRSTVALLRDDKNYGDDFNFIKKGKCNLIISDHAQGWKMNLYASDYQHFNFEEIQNRFIRLNEEYFRSIFFDFAPLFSVPAYLEEPCAALEDDVDYKTNYTYYEHEVMANVIGYEKFLHQDSCTEGILKTETLSSENGRDTVSVTAHSYAGLNRVDLIPTLGGDGKFHNVPVHWVEYIPISRTSQVVIGSEAAPCENATAHYHGLTAGIIK